jgi:tellurite resistance protein
METNSSFFCVYFEYLENTYAWQKSLSFKSDISDKCSTIYKNASENLSKLTAFTPNKKNTLASYFEGYEKAKADSAEKIKRMLDLLNQAVESIKEYRQYEDLVIAMFAVGISVANCDGSLDDIEKQYIEDYIVGESKRAMPKNLKSAIIDLYKNPPTFETATRYAKKVNKESWEIFDILIELVAKSDGTFHDSELKFTESWENFKAAN